MCAKVTHSFADVVWFIAESWFLKSEWNTHTCVILNFLDAGENCNEGTKYCVSSRMPFAPDGGKQTGKTHTLCSETTAETCRQKFVPYFLHSIAYTLDFMSVSNQMYDVITNHHYRHNTGSQVSDISCSFSSRSLASSAKILPADDISMEFHSYQYYIRMAAESVRT